MPVLRGYFKMFAASSLRLPMRYLLKRAEQVDSRRGKKGTGRDESACFPERNVCEPGLLVFVVKFIIFYVTALTMMCFK